MTARFDKSPKSCRRSEFRNHGDGPSTGRSAKPWRRTTELLVGLAAGFLTTSSRADENPSRVKLVLTPICSSALTGVPVVVYVCVQNDSHQQVSVVSYERPWPSGTAWAWQSDQGKTIEMLDASLCIGCERNPVDSGADLVVVPAKRQRRWRVIMPTPKRTGDGSKWALLSTGFARYPSKSELVPLPAHVGMSIRTYSSACLTRLGESSHQVELVCGRFSYSEDLEDCARNGESVAAGILFVRALVLGKDIVARWRALKLAPIEFRALRNARLLDVLESDVKADYCPEMEKSRIDDSTRRALLDSLKPDEPLAAQLRRELERPSDAPYDAERAERIKGRPEPIPAEGESPIP